MEVKISARNFKENKKIEDRINLKMAKLDKFFYKDASAIVTLSDEKGDQKCEITVKQGRFYFRAQVVSKNMTQSFDEAADAIVRQIRKNKTRLQKRYHDYGYETLDFPQDVLETEEDEIKIVRTKRFSFRLMSAEEAVLQMNLLGHEFFVFKNADSGEEVSVVYKRSDGTYGLITSQE